MQQIISSIVEKYGLRKSGSRWAGPCPWCGGSKTTDKFNIRDDGGYKCYACGEKGDIITWLRKMEDMSCREAHQAAGRTCTLTTCRVWDTCSLGSGNGRAPGSRPMPRRLEPKKGKPAQDWPPETTVTMPTPKWQAWANALVEPADVCLAGHQPALSWLAERAIDAVAVARFRLGWLAHDMRVLCTDMDIVHPDGKSRQWIPGGLVIPIYDGYGNIHRLRIRRDKEARAKFLPKLKSVWIRGSGTGPLILRSQLPDPRGVVLVEADLDAFSCAAAHPDVDVVALGTAAAGLPAPTLAALDTSSVILVALDADGPGASAVKRWLSRYRHARYWPVPNAKDPGELAKAGGSIHDWIEAGLVPRIAQDEASSPACSQGGERGAEKEKVWNFTSGDGRVVNVTSDQAAWQEIASSGGLVFSENEIHRLQAAMRELNPEEAAVMASRVLDIKEVFTGAYVRSGGNAE